MKINISFPDDRPRNTRMMELAAKCKSAGHEIELESHECKPEDIPEVPCIPGPDLVFVSACGDNRKMRKDGIGLTAEHILQEIANGHVF